MKYSDRLSDEGLAIFLFHGVVDSPAHLVRNYNRKHLTKQAFADVLDDLSEHGAPVSMDDVYDWCRGEADLPSRSFAITFDDGFENNLSVAAPLLAERNIPATFYITTGFIEHNRMSWIDRIEYCIEQASCPVLDLPWWETAKTLTTAEDKIAALNDIRNEVKTSPGINPDELVEFIFDQCGLPSVSGTDDPLDKKMTWEEVQELARSPLFIVGGHSHNHNILSFLSPEELARDLDTSLALLRDRAGIQSAHYSYPEGLVHCFSDDVIAALKERGITCCPTAEDGINPAGTDPFLLRRIAVA